MRRPKSLSNGFIQSIESPGRYSDGPRAFGLSLLVKDSVRSGVTKSFTQKLRVNGRLRYFGLGAYPLVTLAEARAKAMENARVALQGRDPVFDTETSDIPSLEEAAQSTVQKQAVGWKDGRGTDIWLQRLREYVFPFIGHKRVDLVTSRDVIRVLARLGDKRETRRKVRQYLSSIMVWSIAEGYRADNPASMERIGGALPRAPKQVQHMPSIPVEGMPAALAKIQASNAHPMTKAAIEFLMLTVARSGEVRAATWDEIDLASETWRVPPEHHKMGREHRVPLSQVALAVLADAEEYTGGSGLIFPSPTGRALSDGTLSKLFRELHLNGTPHGCRATFRTWAAEGDVDSELAEYALGHVSGTQVERAYQRSDLFEKRRAVMERWALMLKEA